MREHLADDALALLARGGEGPAQRLHLAGCTDCRTRLAVWQGIGAAVRTAAAEEAVAATSFDVLLGPALAASAPAPAQPAAAPRPRLPAPWQLALQLVLRQGALLPRVWAPLSALGFCGAVVMTLSLGQERLALRLFAAACTLLVLVGAFLVASPRRDPRRELLFTLPVPPAAVFLARLSLVLCTDLLLAAACSAVVGGPGWWPVVTSWLGQALLASSAALALSVRLSPAAGGAAGAALWLLGLLSGPNGVFSTPLDAILGALLWTTPWALALSVLLLTWAATAMRGFTPPGDAA